MRINRLVPIVIALIFIILPTFAVAVTCSGCGSMGAVSATDFTVKSAHDVSNATGLTLEATEAAAVAVYRAEQMSAVNEQRGVPDGQATAQKNVTAIRERWAPLWVALGKANGAHAALVSVLKAYDTISDINAKPSLADVLNAVAALEEAKQAVTDAMKLVKVGGAY